MQAELQNPLSNDPRGGVSAELQFCHSARSHPARTDDVAAAEVIVLCLHLWLNSLVGDCANSTALSRARPVISAAKQTLRTRGVPHVMFGATEYTTTVP